MSKHDCSCAENVRNFSLCQTPTKNLSQKTNLSGSDRFVHLSIFVENLSHSRLHRWTTSATPAVSMSRKAASDEGSPGDVSCCRTDSGLRICSRFVRTDWISVGAWRNELMRLCSCSKLVAATPAIPTEPAVILNGSMRAFQRPVVNPDPTCSRRRVTFARWRPKMVSSSVAKRGRVHRR